MNDEFLGIDICEKIERNTILKIIENDLFVDKPDRRNDTLLLAFFSRFLDVNKALIDDSQIAFIKHKDPLSSSFTMMTPVGAFLEKEFEGKKYHLISAFVDAKDRVHMIYWNNEPTDLIVEYYPLLRLGHTCSIDSYRYCMEKAAAYSFYEQVLFK